MSVVNPNDVLVTEDGHPIGQLVVADNTHVPEVRPAESEIANARLELLRASVRDMTGVLDPDEAIAELYPGYCDVDRKQKAMKLFVSGYKSIEETAEAVGVPPRTVSQWIYVGRWDTLVRHEIAVRNIESALSLEKLRVKVRTNVMEEQLEQARMIRNKAAQNIKEDVGSLKSNTEAWNAAARVEHTIVGVSESGDLASIEDEQPQKEKADTGKTPFVMVFQNGSLPPRPAGGAQ